MPEKIDIPYVTVSDVDKNRMKKVITFDTGKTSINSLMSTLLNNYSIKDISVKESEIDAIISDIYQGKIIVH